MFIIAIQEIFVNPSPFRRRQKVTDVKSDGLPRKKIIALNIRLCMPFSLHKTPFVNRFLAFLITQTFLGF